mgnify:CR=1 FL=1
MKVIFFDWEVACGLNSFMINVGSMPSKEEAFEIIMNHSIESNIDPYFSLWAIYWYDSSNPKEAFQFDKKFKEEKKSSVQEYYQKLINKNQ